MPPPPPLDWPTALVPAVAACARMAAAVAVGAIPLQGFVPLRARIALAVALGIVALPGAVPAAGADVGPLLIAGEVVVGTGLGVVAAAVCAAAAWAGGLVGSVTGLAWSDDFTPEGDPQAAGLARLTAWIGVAGFFAAGGHLAVVGGLIDSFRTLPVGVGIEAVASRAVAAPTLALDLALRLAGPALAAVVAFHLAAAVCVRTVRVAPGAGMLQAAATLVALGIVIAGMPTWLDGFGAAARDRVASGLAITTAAAGTAPDRESPAP